MTGISHQFLTTSKDGEERRTYRFDLGPVQFPPVQHDGVDGVTCAGSLKVGGEDVQEVLGAEKDGGGGEIRCKMKRAWHVQMSQYNNSAKWKGNAKEKLI